MDPNDIPDVEEWSLLESRSSIVPYYTNNYRLTGVNTTISNVDIDMKDTVKKKGLFNLLMKSPSQDTRVCVKEIRMDWVPHGELNHVSFMEVKINNSLQTRPRGSKNEDFFTGLLPIHVHWSISISSPRWITLKNYICNSPWSYSISAKDMPQEELQNAGELSVAYTIEKGTKYHESQYHAPRVILDTAPFPYMVPFYKFMSPGGLSECNISSINKVLKYLEGALSKCGVNNKISMSTIWGISNTLNADMQSKLTTELANDKNGAKDLIEQIIQGIINKRRPGYPSYETMMKMAEGSLNRIVSQEIIGIGEDTRSASRRYST